MKRSLLCCAIPALLLLSCKKSDNTPVAVEQEYTAVVHYYHLENGITQDTSYNITFKTSELNDTMTVSYFLVNGAPSAEKLTEKHVFNTDSISHALWHPYPSAAIIEYPPQHRFHYYWENHNPRGDYQERYDVTGQ